MWIHADPNHPDAMLCTNDGTYTTIHYQVKATKVSQNVLGPSKHYDPALGYDPQVVLKHSRGWLRDLPSACGCRDPQIRGGRCENCGNWLDTPTFVVEIRGVTHGWVEEKTFPLKAEAEAFVARTIKAGRNERFIRIRTR